MAALSAQSPSGPRPGVDWPGFRGINAAGVDDAAALPLQWSVPESKLVKWRVPVSGLGHSSPVVWGDLVCTASAISGTPDPQLKVGLYGDIGSVLDLTQHKWTIACFDKADRQVALGTDCDHGRADRQAPPEVDARQFDPRDGWPSHRGDVRFRRPVRVLDER